LLYRVGEGDGRRLGPVTVNAFNNMSDLRAWINRFEAKANNTCNATIELGSLRRPAPLAIALLPVSPSKGTAPPEAPVVCHGSQEGPSRPHGGDQLPIEWSEASTGGASSRATPLFVGFSAKVKSHPGG
jgi:hypothetical protein